MTWQEDLRRLDENLASGNLSADEYRARRDRILSSAVSSPQDPQDAPGDADSTQVVAPAAGGQSSQPQPSQPQSSQPSQPSQPQPSQPQPSQPQQGPPAQQQPAQQAQQPGPQHGHQDEQAQPGRPEATRVVSPADPTAHPQPAPG
ncbi:SHOCT domain-containing protein, partial [Saccharomonospora halophila]|uniref:SHOCT domain-containing protein n=1 Tax=Saccharomonospora halophila TaxID=129922 RepID=UPI0018DCAA2B